jgi:methylated-DNA-[protein]-cysteine S-methyltransferase
MIYTDIKSPLGEITASAEDGAIKGVWFVGQKYYPMAKNTWNYEPQHPVFIQLGSWLEDYFEGRRNIPHPKLKPEGTDFQKEVWNILLEIPYGQVTTYGKIAEKVAALKGLASMSAQAVGGAVGHNPISILIPCHRVIGANGSLTGYAGGMDKKQTLLGIEKADLKRIW